MRLYSIVMYNISPMQKGVQTTHALAEYHLLHGSTPEYLQWAKKDKTAIFLDGGTSNDGRNAPHIYYSKGNTNLGSMESYFKELKKNKVKCACFYEPDLNWAMSAIVLIADEKIYDKVKYPDLFNRFSSDELERKKGFSLEVKAYGKQTAFLRDLLNRLPLAK